MKMCPGTVRFRTYNMCIWFRKFLVHSWSMWNKTKSDHELKWIICAGGNVLHDAVVRIPDEVSSLRQLLRDSNGSQGGLKACLTINGLLISPDLSCLWPMRVCKMKRLCVANLALFWSPICQRCEQVAVEDTHWWKIEWIKNIRFSELWLRAGGGMSETGETIRSVYGK